MVRYEKPCDSGGRLSGNDNGTHSVGNRGRWRSVKRLILAICLLIPSPSFASFLFESPVTIDHTKVGSTDSTNFPVWVTFTATRFKVTGSGGHVTSSSGFDIRPYGDVTCNTTPYNFELVTYGGSTSGTITEIWTQIPTVSHTADTTFYLCYDNSSLTTDGSSTSTWDSNYITVLHMGDGSTLSTTNSKTGGIGRTSVVNAIAGTVSGAAQIIVSGFIAYDGTSGSENTSLPGSSDTTFEYWEHKATADVTSGCKTWFLTLNGATEFCVYDPHTDNTFYWDAGNGTTARVSIPYATYLDAWTHVVLVSKADNSFGAIYLNGTQVATRSTGAQPTAAMSGLITPYIDGEVDYDEMRMSKTVRSADWVTASYNNQHSPSTFLTLGAEAPVSGGGGSTCTKSGMTLLGVGCGE